MGPLLHVGFGYLVLIGVASMRLGIILLIMPVFTRTGLTGAGRFGVAVALSVPVALHLLGSFEGLAALGIGQLTLLILKEAFLGLLLGLGFGLPFWAAGMAGDVFDFQRGSLQAYLVDPTQISEESITGTFLQLIMVALFYVGGGPHLLLSTLYDSYALWPPLAELPRFVPESGVLLLGMLDRMMMIAVLLAAPLIIVLLMVDATMALLGRAAPQLHIFFLSLPVKAIAVFAVLPVYIAFFIHHADTLLGDQPGVLATLKQFFS